MDEFTISVIIADRPYRLTIRREEEEMIRKAAQSLNGTIKEYSGSYAFKDKQDLLAMAALEYATNMLIEKKEIEESERRLVNRLKSIDTVLSGVD